MANNSHGKTTVTFLYGTDTNKKTEYILNKIRDDVDNGRSAFWLVPEQNALACERLLASELDPSAQLYAEVLNFSRLCDKVFRVLGGLKYNYIARNGKNLIMYLAIKHARENNLLKEYTIAEGREHGCVSLFLDVIGELKSYAVTPAALLEASEKLESDRLKNRISDLVCVFEKYNEILSSKYSDPYDSIIKLADMLSDESGEGVPRCDIFDGASIYVSSFYGFTGAQMNVLKRVFAKALNVTVSLDVAKDELKETHYTKLAKTDKGLRKIAPCEEKEIEEKSFDEKTGHSTEALSYLCKNIWSFTAPPFANHDGIKILRPRDEFDECELVASEISKLIMGGAKYSEIAVIVRKTDTYRGIINYIFDKYNIKYYMSAGSDLQSKPLSKLLYSAINAATGWSVRDIAAFMRSGYAGISDEEADLLEDYMYRWGIYGKRFEDDSYWSANPDGYTAERTADQIARLSTITATRSRIIELLAPIKKAFTDSYTMLELCTTIYNFLHSLNIKDKLKEEKEEADKAYAMEAAQLYSALIDALDLMASIMPNETPNAESFLNALTYALEGSRVGTIPTGDDNVIIGEADTLRASGIKYAFVIGVTEGSFPAATSNASFFSDSDKIALESEGIILSDRSDVRAANEMLSFKNSISFPSDVLYVSSPKADIRGAKKEPSIAFSRIITLFPTLLPKSEDKKDTSPKSEEEKKAEREEAERQKRLLLLDKIYTESVAREFSGGDDALSVAIRELLNITKKHSFNLSNEALSISADGARELIGTDIYLSQSRIERFVSCHFQYYCEYLLGLKDSEVISFGSSEVGTLSHLIFELFLRDARKNNEEISSLTDAQIEKKIEKITSEYTDKVCEGSAPSERLSHLFERLKTNLIVYVKELAEELSQCKPFEPSFFELKFSSEPGELCPMKFELEDNATITMSGTVDRVDVYRDDDAAYVRVVDYKTNDKKFRFDDFYHGLELQLLIYLFTLCNMPEGDFKSSLLDGRSRIVPAGVQYFPMSLGKANVDDEIDLEASEAAEKEREAVSDLVKRSGVYLDDPKIIGTLDKSDNHRYIPKKTKKNAMFFRTEDGFKTLYNELSRTIQDIGKSLLSGDAAASPLKLKSHTEPCEYCPHRAVCRRRSK